MSIKLHKKWMLRCIRIAEKGRGLVSPNPLVGACVVKKGRLISEGYHAYFGGPHAEQMALKRAGKKAKGATLYVSLEPCSTYGKTPPCTDEIIQSGIKKLVMGVNDPNPIHSKKSERILKKHRIHVLQGILREEVAKQNETFFKFHTEKLPFVTVKVAQSFDVKTRVLASRLKIALAFLSSNLRSKTMRRGLLVFLLAKYGVKRGLSVRIVRVPTKHASTTPLS